MTLSSPLSAGDAEAHKLQASQYVTIPDEKWTGTPKDMHQRAASIMRKLTSVQHPLLGEIKFTAQGRRKTLFDKRTPHEFQSVQALPELALGGRLVSSKPDRKAAERRHVPAFHKLEHRLKIGDAKYRAEITVKDTEQGGKTAHRFYLHRIQKE